VGHVMLFKYKRDVFLRILREMHCVPSAARKNPTAQSQSLVVGDVIQQNWLQLPLSAAHGAI